MAWIKRNLFFVVGGILTLGLLGGAGFYIYSGWSHNSAAFDKLNEVVNTLSSLTGQSPSPGNDKVDNIQIAKDQDKELTAWIDSSVGYFRPIPPIPRGPVTSATYAGALSSTIAQLQQEAKSDGITLPPQECFSFSAQASAMAFAPGSLNPLAEQLGEAKAIVEMLFAARVNALDSVQRVRVSADDVNGTQSDYIDELPVTNELAVVTPYAVTFRCFTPELAQVIAEFATASNTFIIKSVDVQPASPAADMAGGVPGEMQPGPDAQQQAIMAARYRGYRGAYPPQPTAPGYLPTASKGGLQTVLKEQLLLVRLEVELVKLSPKR